MNVLFFIRQVDQAITLCSEMHNIKAAIYENKSKLEGIGEDYQIQVSDDAYLWDLKCKFSLDVTWEIKHLNKK